jgi:putative flavoprotein involved in K+ transport
MRFIGYTNPVSGMFREIAIDARRIARAIKADGSAGIARREAAPPAAAPDGTVGEREEALR